MKMFDKINMAIGGILTMFTVIFGEHGILFLFYLALQASDFVSRWAAARITHTEKSDACMKGIVKKLGYWIAILAAFLFGYIFNILGEDFIGVDLSNLTVIGWYVLACFAINEVRSIFENLVECGINMPGVLVKGLQIADDLVNKDADKE